MFHIFLKERPFSPKPKELKYSIIFDPHEFIIFDQAKQMKIFDIYFFRYHITLNSLDLLVQQVFKIFETYYEFLRIQNIFLHKRQSTFSLRKSIINRQIYGFININLLKTRVKMLEIIQKYEKVIEYGHINARLL